MLLVEWVAVFKVGGKDLDKKNRDKRKNLRMLYFCFFSVVFITISLCLMVSASETDYFYPTQEGDTFSDWNNPLNAGASDDSDTDNPTYHTGAQDYHTYKLSGSALDDYLPSNICIIDYVEVIVEADSKHGSLDCTLWVNLTGDDHDSYTDPKSLNIEADTDDEEYIFNFTSLSGWNRDNLADTNFRICLNISYGGIFLDCLKVKVGYRQTNYYSSSFGGSVTVEENPIEYTYYSSSFGGSVTVGPSIDIEVNITNWDIGSIGTGAFSQNNFMFHQNGSSTLDVLIGFNDTNYTYVNWATYRSNGLDQYTANFSINNWGSETNIAPKSGNDPVTLLYNDLLGNSGFDFGIRLWIPKNVLKYDHREDFDIHLNATISD